MSSKITMVADSTQADEGSGKKKHLKKKKKVADKKGKKSKKGNIRKKSAKNPEDSESESDLDLTKELKPIGQYVKDRDAMLQEMFKSIGLNKLKTMLPDILKPLPIEELHKLCVDQLEVMSKKRIRRILDGDDPANISSSGTEEESSDDEIPKPDLQSQAADSTSQPGIDGSVSHHSHGSISPSSGDHSPHSSKAWSEDSDSEGQEATPEETVEERAVGESVDTNKQIQVGDVTIKQEKEEETAIQIKEEPLSEDSDIEPGQPWRRPEDDNIAPSEEPSQCDSDSLVSESGSEEGEVRYRKKNDSQEEDSGVERQNEVVGIQEQNQENHKNEEHNSEGTKEKDKRTDKETERQNIGKENDQETTKESQSESRMVSDEENAENPQVIVIAPIENDKEEECSNQVETETNSQVANEKNNESLHKGGADNEFDNENKKATVDSKEEEVPKSIEETENVHQTISVDLCDETGSDGSDKSNDESNKKISSPSDDYDDDKAENIQTQSNKENLNETNDNVSKDTTPEKLIGDKSIETLKSIEEEIKTGERLDIQVQVEDDRVSDLSDDRQSLLTSPVTPSAEQVTCDAENNPKKTVEEPKKENEVKKLLRPRILPPSPDKTERLSRVSSFSNEQDLFIIHVSTDDGNSESDSEANESFKEREINSNVRVKGKEEGISSVNVPMVSGDEITRENKNASRASDGEETKGRRNSGNNERQKNEARKYVNSGRRKSVETMKTTINSGRRKSVETMKTTTSIRKPEIATPNKCAESTQEETKPVQASGEEDMLKKENELRKAIASRLKAAEAKSKEKETSTGKEDTRKICVAEDVNEEKKMAGVGISGRRIVLKKTTVTSSRGSDQKEKHKSSDAIVTKRASFEDTREKYKRKKGENSADADSRSKNKEKKSSTERRVIKVKEEIRAERRMMKAASSPNLTRTKAADRHSRYAEGQSSRMYSDYERKDSTGFTRRDSYRDEHRSPGRRNTLPRRMSSSARSRSPQSRSRDRDHSSQGSISRSPRAEKRPYLTKSVSDSKVPKLAERSESRSQERRTSAPSGKGDVTEVRRSTEKKHKESAKYEEKSKSTKTHSKSKQIISTETAEPEIKKVLVTTADGRKIIKTIKTIRVIKRVASTSRSTSEEEKHKKSSETSATTSPREIATALKATHQLPKVSTLKADDPELEKEIMDEMEILELEMRARAIKAMLEKQEAKEKKDSPKKGSKTKKSTKK